MSSWKTYSACLTIALLSWLHPANATEPYQATVQPQADVDQADPNITGTIAWHLNNSARAGGGVIHLLAGQYRIRESLIIPNHTTLIGQDQQTVIRAHGRAFFDHLINNAHSDDTSTAGVRDVTLAHLTLIGKPDVRLNCIQLVGSEADRSQGIALSDLTVHHCGRHGIHVKGANQVSIQNITAYSNGTNVDHDHNIYLLRVTGARVDHINTHHAAGNGFSSTLLRNATLNDIRSWQNGRRGLRFGGGQNISVTNCVARQNGLKLDHQADGIVITSDDFNNLSQNITIDSCIVKHNRDHCIWITAASDITLTNNTVANNPAGDVVYY